MGAPGRAAANAAAHPPRRAAPGTRGTRGQHEAAARGRGVDLRALAGEHPQAHAASRQVLHGVDQVGEVPAESHVSDRFSPFATQTIPATVHEAPYILDGLLMNETGRRVREQYADTGGFTDHVFAACSILGYAFVPRIRDLPSKRLYVFERAGVPKHLRPLVGGKVNVDLIDRNWADILRVAATMAAGPCGRASSCASSPRSSRTTEPLAPRGETPPPGQPWSPPPDETRRGGIRSNASSDGAARVMRCRLAERRFPLEEGPAPAGRRGAVRCDRPGRRTRGWS